MDSQTPIEPIDPEVNAPLVQPPPPQPHTNPFVGRHGLRAGWKLLIFYVVMIAIIAALMTVGFMFVPRPAPHTTPKLNVLFLAELVEAAGALLATGVMAKLIDKKPWGYFGLPLTRAFRSEFWIGALVGFAALAIQLEVMHLGGWFNFGSITLHGSAILRWGILWAFFFLCTGFFEEGMLRGYPQRILTNGIGFWPAAVLLSLLFASLHLSNTGENRFGIFMVFIDGMLMCFTLWRTGNMWFAVGNHAAWDWSQTFFFGTPDSGLKPIGALMSPSFHGPALLSGGTDGPEGSVLVIVSELLIALAVAFLYRKRKYPLLRDETPAPEALTLDTNPAITPPQTA